MSKIYDSNITSTTFVLVVTRERHPQLPSERLGDPHGDEPLRLLRAEHVDAAAELGEVILPQLLLHLLAALKQSHGRTR